MDIEAEFLAFKEEWRDYLVRVRMNRISNISAGISMEDEKEKFHSGRVAYGGEFSPMNIRHEMEMRDEVLDFVNYSDMQEFCIWKDDPASFEEYVSQYMQ